jgi:exopolysaccharide production protein ExoY
MNPVNPSLSSNGFSTANGSEPIFDIGSTRGFAGNSGIDIGCPSPAAPNGADASRVTLSDSYLIGLPTGLSCQNEPAASARLPQWKQILDLSCICVTFPFWSAAMAVVSAWILLASPGPLLYRQERIGYRGRRFKILKFRTMKVNVETTTHEGYFRELMQADCPMTKLDCRDARLIRGGRLLRALALDELPQIFNVVRGEMSLVGPRPCTPQEFDNYRPAQKERVNAPPGLTGYWQVSGKNKTTFSEMIAMDLFYSRNMSVLLDLRIMLSTLPAIALQVLESLSRKAGAAMRPPSWMSFGQLQRKRRALQGNYDKDRVS